MKKLIAMSILISAQMPAWAVARTVTLSVPGMDCAACPLTVKKALGKVAGVSKIEVSLERRDAKVSFDDAKTNVEALMHATQEAGYPSTVKGAAQ
jgi:mercuric ion binding protein